MTLLKSFLLTFFVATSITVAQKNDASKTLKPVLFSAMGCGPYSTAAEVALAKFIVLENTDPTSSFIIHCGDIVTGKVKDWPESQYEKVAGILTKGNAIPTFIVPGDNEWNDQENPDKAWGFWDKHFMGFHEKWKLPESASKVARQKIRPENFAFVLDGVLFIGINKVGGMVHDTEEWETRLNQDAAWISEHFTKHKAEVHSAVIFAQASAFSKIAAFQTQLAKIAVPFEKPILYLHADGHKWTVDPGEWSENITRVQLDVVNAKFPPIQVRVTGNSAEPFIYDRRLEDSKWKLPEAITPPQ
ncbi:MAG: metallophosphoesterase [Verrucomicrobiales bacterium]